jgi:hypothetical protein
MAKKMSSFQELGREVLGYEIFTVFAVDLINSSGRKGLKLIRIEDSTGQNVPVHEFIKKYHIDPKSLNVDFIGMKGYQVSNKVRVLKIKAKRKEQESQENK